MEPEVLTTHIVLERQTAAWLIVHALNILFLDNSREGCCPECCGACAAIKQLLDAGQLDDAIITEGERHSWWTDGRVDRDWLRRAWRMTSCHPVKIE